MTLFHYVLMACLVPGQPGLLQLQLLTNRVPKELCDNPRGPSALCVQVQRLSRWHFNVSTPGSLQKKWVATVSICSRHKAVPYNYAISNNA